MTLMAGHEIAPLPPGDVLQAELAEVDETFVREYGPDMAAWLPTERAAYNAAIDAVWASTSGRCTGGAS